MSDLYSSLTMATRSLEAQRFALSATGQNIANVNTRGYSRRVVDFRAVPPEHRFSAGRGVEVAALRAERDRFIQRRLEQETTSAHRERALADSLGIVEVALGPSGQTIDARLTAFFDSFSRLADAPTSAVARQEVAQAGNALATAFRNTSERLSQSRRDVNTRVGGAVEDINTLVSRIAVLNQQRSAVNDSTALHLQDEQTELIRQLSELVDIRVIERADGGLDIDAADGRALVVGTTSFTLSTNPVGPEGMLQIIHNGVNITGEITGGRLGGLLQARDVHIPSYLQRLDDQAFELHETVNTIHAAGFDLSGNTGQNFFAYIVPVVGSAGAAAALTVDPAITADPSRIAAAQAALPGDNRNARALAAVRDLRVLDGGTATLHDGWSELVYRVGRDVQAARTEATLSEEVARQVETLRDQVSGVSLDEEATNLVKYQRAYEANARFFRVVDQTLDTLMNTFTR